MPAGDRISVRPDQHAAAHTEQAAFCIIGVQLEYRGHAVRYRLVRGQRLPYLKRNCLPQRRLHHARHDRGSFTALDGAVRQKPAGCVRTSQDARSVQQICRVGVIRPLRHIGDRPVLHGIDLLERLLRKGFRQHIRERAAGRRRFIAFQRRGQDAVFQRIRRINRIPRRGCRKVRRAVLVNAMQAGRQLDRFRHREAVVRRKGRLRNAVDQAVFIGQLHVFRIPGIRRHIRKLAGIGLLFGKVLIACERRRGQYAQRQHSAQKQAEQFSFHRWFPPVPVVFFFSIRPAPCRFCEQSVEI